MHEFFQRLKQRKLVQWAIAYVAAAFALLQGLDIVANRFDLPSQTIRLVILGMIVGFFVVLVLAWYHGERGAQKVSGTELILLGLVLAVGGGFLWRFAAVASSPKTANPTAPNEQSTPAATQIPAKSIAVLPFENLSEEKSNAYFAEGIQDEILTKLASIADLKVISRTSTDKYKSKPDDLKTVSQQLGVAHVLEGSVQKSGGKIRVNVQLIDARADSHLWAKSYDGDAKDIFGIETKVSQQVAEALSTRLSRVEANAIATAPTNDAAAYDLFLRAESIERRAEDEVQAAAYDEAARLYEQAVAADPNFALALSRLVENRMLRQWYFEKLPQAEIEKLQAMAERAIAIAPDLPDAHIALGVCYYYGYRDYDRALVQLNRAIQLQPNNARAIERSGYVHRRQGAWALSNAELERAVQLDPRNTYLAANLAGSYAALRMWPEAERYARRALAIDPATSDAMGALFDSSVGSKGDVGEVLRLLGTFSPGNKLTSSGTSGVEGLIGVRAYGYVLARDFEAARKVWDTTEGADHNRQLTARVIIALLKGDQATARNAATEAQPLLEARARETPNDILTLSELSWVYLSLGREAEAVKLARQAAATVSLERDALFGPGLLTGLAEILARVGASAEATEILHRLLVLPGGSTSINALKTEPVWDSIRKEPAFQKLLKIKEHIGP